MYRKILGKVGLKRLPPVLVPFAAPFVIIVVIFVILCGLFEWLLGFWRCTQCHRTYWITHDRKATKETEEDFWRDYVCDPCQTMNFLTGKDEITKESLEEQIKRIRCPY